LAATRTTTASDKRVAVLSTVRAIPAWAWLTLLVVVSAVIRYALSRQAVAPWIMVDELIYSELAKSFADSGQFLIRDHSTAAYGVIYPALIAPAWAAFKSIPDAYAAAKAINSLMMSLAAIPAYLLARRMLSAPWALGAAVLTVAVPSMVYTGTLMTENAFYPIFLFALLATIVWLERPTTTTTLWVVALVALAYLTRAQALSFGPTILTAPLLYAWAQRRSWRSLRDYRLMYGLVLAGGLLVIIVQVARGASPLGILGAYQVAGETHYHFWPVLEWLWYQLGVLDLSLGIVPLAAMIVLAALARGQDRHVQAFLAGSIAATFWLMVEVAAFASVHQLRVEERNTFYVVPLFLIALLVWIDRGTPRPSRIVAVAALTVAALPGVLPYQRLITTNAVSDTLTLLPIWSLQTALFPIEQTTLVVVLACMCAAALFVLVPRRYALVLPVIVLAYFAISQKPIEGKHKAASVGALFSGITLPREWVDQEVGHDQAVATIWSGQTSPYAIWENEIFNRSLRRFYYLHSQLAGDLPEQKLKVDAETGVMSSGGNPVRARYALTDSSVQLDGRMLRQDPRTGMTLYETTGPLRQVSQVTGLYPNDTWSGRYASYTRLGCHGGKLRVALQSDPGLFKKPQTVIARIGGEEAARVQIPPGGAASLVVPLPRGESVCNVDFEVTPTAVPAVVTKGYNTDVRELGAHFSFFEYTPAEK
jgi:Dolichyl-phosphate-mannose-protein mannosyltransferase